MLEHHKRVKELEETHSDALKSGNTAEAKELYKHLNKGRSLARTIDFHHNEAARHQAEIDRHTATIKSGKLQPHQIKATQGVIDIHKQKHKEAMEKAKKTYEGFGSQYSEEQFDEVTHHVFHDHTHDQRVMALSKKFGGLKHPDKPNKFAIPKNKVHEFHAAASKAGLHLKHKSPTGAYHYGSAGELNSQHDEEQPNEYLEYLKAGGKPREGGSLLQF